MPAWISKSFIEHRFDGSVSLHRALKAVLTGGSVKPTVFALALVPVVWLMVATLANRLGANPAEALVRATGDWTLRFLCIVLSVTPVRVVARLPELARLRRMLGLFTFFYAVLHLLCYGLFDMGLEPERILKDIGKRPFILVGFTAFALLAALAVTSLGRVIQAMGGRRWRWGQW